MTLMQLLQYMENIQLQYHKAAEEKGVYAISSCGFDSIPADLGTVFLMNKLKGLCLRSGLYLLLEFNQWFMITVNKFFSCQ
jgi:short subunit dehydrogenase-like uncharacterized protein